jgi:hypothetical protein
MSLNIKSGDTQLRAAALLAVGRDTAPRLREPYE